MLILWVVESKIFLEVIGELFNQFIYFACYHCFSSPNINHNFPEEKLTHKGQELTKVEKYDRTMLSDEDDDDEARRGGSIGANIVAAVHFGGGIAASAENAASKRLVDLSCI